MAREQVFQNRLLVELSKLPGVRVWRQNSGKTIARRGGAVKGAPVGAADITGIVGPEGWRIEIECKAGAKLTEKQRHWIATMLDYGALAVVVVFDDRLSIDANVEAVAAKVREVIAARRAGG